MILDTKLNDFTNCFKEMWKTFNGEQFKQEQEANKLEYQKEKEVFDADPIHWSNNKRRLHRLNCLRGKINKTREKQFIDYSKWSLFKILEEVVDYKIGKYANENEFFGTFAEVKGVENDTRS